MTPESFHFLRPAWLLALLPIAGLLWSALHRSPRTSAWRRLVDEHLLRHLLVGGETGARRWPLWALGAAWVSACLALAGPTWQRLPQPLFGSLDPTVIALDLSRSMEKPDLAPSRRMRARYELQDILDRLRGGQVGLVVFSDEPFVALPLTDDDRVVSEWIPSLTGDLMPSDGDRADRAIDQAAALLEQSGAGSGRILLITDGLGGDAPAGTAAAARAAALGHEVSVLGMAPEPALDRPALEAIAAAGNGHYATVTADGTDLDRVLVGRALGGPSLSPESFAHADEWRDAGVWLLILPVLLAPLAFRRGWLVAAALWLALAPSTRAEASLWADLWQRRDQQGAAALAGGDSEAAAGLFEDPAWRGAAQYEAGKFAEAAKTYRNLDGSASDYNLGNALARAGDLRAALAAYDDALAAKPEDADARFNRDLVERLLREQEEQKQSQQENQPQGEPSSGEQNQENEEQSSQPDGGAQQAQNQPRNEESSSDGQPSAAGSRSADEKRGGEDGSAQNDAPSRSQASATGEKHPETAAGEATPSDDGAKPDDGSELAQDGGTPGEDQVARSPGQHTDESQANSVSKQLDEVLDGNAPEAGPEPREKPATANAARGDGRPLSEEEQAREQRLRQVPDDPGGLLRAKIHRRYAEKRYAQEGLVPW